MNNLTHKNNKKKNLIVGIIMAVLIVLILPILIINVTLIIKGTNKEEPPSVFGYAPLVVVSPSMEGNLPDSFNEGALVLIKVLDDEKKQELKVNDIICFRAPDDHEVFVTHRIISVNKDDSGKIVSFITMGDANNGTSDGVISIDLVLGKCTKSINGLGNFALFMQSPAGILIFIGLPICAFIVYDVLKVRNQNKKAKEEESKNKQEEELQQKEEEIKRLQAMLDEKNKDE